jgi:tRNA(fMet)-specific endonuclease VapC
MFLLDTNTLSARLDPAHKHYKEINEFLASITLFENFVYLSSITLGEMGYGYEVAARRPNFPPAKLSVIRLTIASVKQIPNILAVNEHVANTYSEIKAKLIAKKMPKLLAQLKGKTPVWPDDWIDETTAKKLGISENDLWIAAVAITYNLILVTADPDMAHIHEAAPELTLQQIA